MNIEDRAAALREFLESRDRQLSLPMADCGEDDRQEGGRFGPGNDCGGSGGNKTAEQSQQVAADAAVMTKTASARIVGRGEDSTKSGFPSAWRENADFSHRGGIPGADKIASLEVNSPGDVWGTSLGAGVGSVADLLRIGAATYRDSEVSVVGDQSGASLPRSNGRGYGYDPSAYRTVVDSQVPIRAGGKGEVIGKATIEVALVSSPDEDFDSMVSYGYFQVDREVKRQIGIEKAVSGNTGFSKTESHIGAMIIDMMSESLSAAQKSGVKKAKTMAAGFPGSGDYQGYRLWPRFGFDADLPGSVKQKLKDALASDPDLLTATGKRELSRDSISLQRLLQTKKGEKFWKENGTQLDLVFDFTKKRSLGYKKFKRMQEIAAAAKKRGSRSFAQFCDVVFRSYVCEDIARWPVLLLNQEKRSEDCGTGAGGFKPGNDCGGGKPLMKQVGGARDSEGKQTRAARKMYSLGMSERKVASMIESLGGDPGKSAVKISLNRLHIHVKDKDGGRSYVIEVRTKGARVFRLGGGKPFSKDESESIKKIVKAATPEKVKGKTDQDFSVSVHDKPEDYKAWKQENADRYKAIEEKYKYTVYVPPHRRREKRNCGTGSGGFQKGNTCSGQAAKDVVAGAAKGAASGAGAAVGKTAGFPPAVAAGAAAGAAVGAVKGLYDNRMRPTRAAKAIRRIGSSDEHVASVVSSLGGSSKSVAEADGRDAVSLDVKGQKGESRFNVRMTKGEVLIRPSKGRLTDDQIQKIKKLSEESKGTSFSVVVQDQPTSVLSSIVKAGFTLAVDAAFGLVAGALVPMAPAIAGTAIEASTGIDIEKTRVMQKAGEVLLGNIKKQRV